MKELSIEQKAKAYDEAFDKVAHFIKKHIGFGCMIHPNSSEAKELFNIFPQLKESEDESIRKELINYFIKGKEYLSLCSFSKEEILTWLEKQGGHDSNEDGLIAETIKYKNEKQGEQKPTDKVELKFKVGDWLVHNERRNIIKVVNATPLDYEVVDVLGNHHIITDVAIEENYHLWTIKDAKEGDVLAAEPIYNYSFPFIGIYKERGVDFFNSHCFIGFDGNFYNETTGHVINNIHPATKEQRDILMKAMANARWKFDFEKKELRKIEQKSTKWSEEDNEMIFKICQNLYDYPRVKSPFDRESFNEAEKEVQFIKSIRPQNQWKPTEEQMKALAEALSLAKNCGEESAFDLRTLYEQLKNL